MSGLAITMVPESAFTAAQRATTAKIMRTCGLGTCAGEVARGAVRDRWPVYAADAGGQVVGFAVVNWDDGGNCRLQNLGVDPAARGAGVGSDIVVAIAAEALRRETGTVMCVPVSDRGLTTFYERLGLSPSVDKFFTASLSEIGLAQVDRASL